MARADDDKSKLVVDICVIALRYASCNHHRRHATKPVFVDWYLVLGVCGVDEDATSDVIRWRYRQLVLQIHPDKNQHPKSETAFMLVLQAYEILADKHKRKAFNIERWTRACKECRRRSTCPSNTHANEKHELNRMKQMRTTKISTVSESTKEARERFKEEVKVIGNCLRKMGSSSKEHPLFDPSDTSTFHGYPHARARVFSRSNDAWLVNNARCRSYYEGEGKCETPAYEIKQPIRDQRWSNMVFPAFYGKTMKV